jgi:hypothetical protein
VVAFYRKNFEEIFSKTKFFKPATDIFSRTEGSSFIEQSLQWLRGW